MVSPYRNESLLGGMGKEHRLFVCNHLERPGVRQHNRYQESICHVGQRQEDHEESDVAQGRHIILSSYCFLIPQRRHLPHLKPKIVKLGHGIFAKTVYQFLTLARDWEPSIALQEPLNPMQLLELIILASRINK